MIRRRHFDKEEKSFIYAPQNCKLDKFLSSSKWRYDLIRQGIIFTSLKWIDDCYGGWVRLNGSKPNLRIGRLAIWSKLIGSKWFWRSNVRQMDHLINLRPVLWQRLYTKTRNKLWGNFHSCCQTLLYSSNASVDQLDLELSKMDVKIAFLNRELDEEIFMEKPNWHLSQRKWT